jgi:hypothetical protein
MFGMTGCTGAFWPISLESCIVRAADEGIPVGSIKRVFLTSQINVDERDLIAQGVITGRLIEKPPEDWAALVPRRLRATVGEHHKSAEDDDELIIKMARTLRTTKQESCVLMVVLRRGLATREMLHNAVEANRGNPDDATGEKIVDVVLCKIRKKLKLWGIKLQTVHGTGYEMPDADREKAWAIIRGEETCH